MNHVWCRIIILELHCTLRRCWWHREHRTSIAATRCNRELAAAARLRGSAKGLFYSMAIVPRGQCILQINMFCIVLQDFASTYVNIYIYTRIIASNMMWEDDISYHIISYHIMSGDIMLHQSIAHDSCRYLPAKIFPFPCISVVWSW